MLSAAALVEIRPLSDDAREDRFCSMIYAEAGDNGGAHDPPDIPSAPADEEEDPIISRLEWLTPLERTLSCDRWLLRRMRRIFKRYRRIEYPGYVIYVRRDR